MSDFQLSSGDIENIYNEEHEEEPKVQGAIFQVLSCKKVDNVPQGGQDRFRIIVSDGIHFMQGMLSTRMNHLASSGQLEKMAVIQVNQYACNNVQGRKIMILLEVSVVGQANSKIGDPKAIGAGGPAPQAQKPAAPQQSNATPAARNGMIAKAGGSSAPARPAQRSSAPTAASSNKGAASKSGFPIFPIEGLSPYQNKWTIKARVMGKSDIKHWSNARGEGKLFNVTLVDETGEIRATGFNQQVDQFYDMLQDGKAYYVSKARVNIAKKQFNNTNNEYELSLGNETEISLCEDAADIPALKFNFVELGRLTDVEKDQMCDVVGVVKDVSELSSITTKATQRQLSKRELGIVDKTGFSVRLTLWGKQAEQFAHMDQPVIAFRGVKVGDFGGRSLSMVSSSSMMVEPDIPESHELRGWFDQQGAHAEFQSYNSSMAGVGGGGAGSFKPHEFRTIQQARDEGLGQGEQPNYFNLRGTVVFIKGDNLSYPACPTDRCNKKVVKEDDHAWRCEKCEKVHEAPEYRYILNLSVGDYTGQCWLSGFNDVGKLLLGATADEMEKLREDDEALFKNKLQKANCQMWDFACRAKSDTFNDQVKVRYQILQVRSVDYEGACKDLVDRIAKYGLLES